MFIKLLTVEFPLYTEQAQFKEQQTCQNIADSQETLRFAK